MIIPSRDHAPPSILPLVRTMVIGVPPASRVFFRASPATNASHAPSGEKKGSSAPSVPGSACVAASPSRRTRSGSPSEDAMYAIVEPLGDIAGQQIAAPVSDPISKTTRGGLSAGAGPSSNRPRPTPTARNATAPTARSILRRDPLLQTGAPAAICDIITAGSCSASAKSAAESKRSAGIFANACSTASATCTGTDWRSVTHRLDRLGEHLRDHRLHRAARVRRLAREHLVQHGRERVDVAARVRVAVARRLLGAHVMRRAEREPGLRDPIGAGVAHRQRDAEVGHERAGRRAAGCWPA